MYDLVDLTFNRKPVEQVVGDLKSNSAAESMEAARKFIGACREHGVRPRDYLKLIVEPGDQHRKMGLSGYELALKFLNLPVKNELSEGVLLRAASETFQKYPGTRAMFPEVVEDMLIWQNRQDQFVSTAALVANSRTVAGTELISTVVLDDSAARGTYTIAELARIPVRTIRTSEQSVRFFKHGSGYRTSYEFERRASLDLLTPFANRVARELEISKVGAATHVLINGDGINAAAPVVNQSTYDAAATPGKISYTGLIKWLVANASTSGLMLDTVVGNWDAYVEWLFLFAMGNSTSTETDAAVLSRAGVTIGQIPVLNFNVQFVLSPSMPANRLLGMTRGETLEELIEAGSLIAESEQSIQNQSVTYVRTANTGYKLAFDDTRVIYDFGA